MSRQFSNSTASIPALRFALSNRMSTLGNSIQSRLRSCVSLLFGSNSLLQSGLRFVELVCCLAMMLAFARAENLFVLFGTHVSGRGRVFQLPISTHRREHLQTSIFCSRLPRRLISYSQRTRRCFTAAIPTISSALIESTGPTARWSSLIDTRVEEATELH